MMIFGLLSKKNGNAAIVERQYGFLTSAARVPALYLDHGVPDTVMGRFEMLSAVLILYFRRTRTSRSTGQQIAQAIVDAFFEDVDHSIRELGVGDAGVPKRMKKFAGMFYGRLETYAAALEAKNVAALAAGLERNLYPEGGADARTLERLATYMLAVEATLSATDEDLVEVGRLHIPAPDAI